LGQPSVEAELLAMQQALAKADMTAQDIDYINAHATSTVAGDAVEAKAITRLFGGKPMVSSTKSMTGHECWMAGASEAVYSILMMLNSFVAPNINIEELDDSAKYLNVVSETRNTEINLALTNSFGFGGTNCVLVFKKI